MSEGAEKPVKKRFIAGAVCPRCGEMDRIVNYKIGDKNFRECVACGFKDEIRLQASPREVPTRVRNDETEIAIKILQPNKTETKNNPKNDSKNNK